jgi:tetratricopeptide (TPR) repeat protein
VSALLHLALLLLAAPTPEHCRALEKHGDKPAARTCFQSLASAPDPSIRAEAFWGLQQWDQANESFRQALAQQPTNANVRVRWGLLLHERFNNKEADDLFHEALKLDPNNAHAYLGLAIVSADGFDSKAEEYSDKALALDPKLAEAHELRANLLLTYEKPKDALEEADKALALSNEALEAMAVHAAIEILADRDPAPWFARIQAINPHDGVAYAFVGQHLVLNRRYNDGVAYYRKAIAADPDLWSAQSQLGINLMRLGQEEEPLKLLASSYEHGQRDAATVNSLRLLDSYKNFVTIKDSTTILRLRKNEVDLLQPYFQPELHKAIATYQAKYHMTLPAPVQLEVYPDHEDFAVRTMGMPGLGALGVTFGEVVAMDSPSGRKPGDFNWGATLWHELSHVYILQATNHRVPRWFTEGLAVHEEGQAHAEWSNRLTPDILVAIRDKKLLPVANMDQGFIFPEYPSQVIVSYFQAGSICDYIAERWGESKLLDMVHSFAALKPTPKVIEEDLKLSPTDFDKAYMQWLDKQVGDRAKNFDKWRNALKALAVVKDDGITLETAPNVIALYPEYVGDANAYEMLAAAQLAKNNKPAAIKTLEAYAKMGGESPEALTKLAALEEEQGDKAAAAKTLESINYIYPENEALHRHLGELDLALSHNEQAIREFAAVVALKPLDQATAHYELAQAYLAAGKKDKAEESVLAALEAAPGFRPAQKLLVQIKANNP